MKILFKLVPFLSLTFPFIVSAEPTVDVAGLLIISDKYVSPESPDDKFKGEIFRTTKAFPNTSPGVRLALMAKMSEGVIVGIDPEKSKLTTWKDNTGKVFKKDENVPRTSHPVDHGIKDELDIARDHKAALIEIGAHQFPAKGATHLIAQGEVALKTAQGKKTYRTDKPVKISEGETFQLDATEYTIAKVEEKNGETFFSIHYRADRDSFIEFSFRDGKGKEIKTVRNGSAFSHYEGNTQKTSRSYRMEGAVKDAVIELSLWDNLKITPVKLDLKVGLDGSNIAQ